MNKKIKDAMQNAHRSGHFAPHLFAVGHQNTGTILISHQLINLALTKGSTLGFISRFLRHILALFSNAGKDFCSGDARRVCLISPLSL